MATARRTSAQVRSPDGEQGIYRSRSGGNRSRPASRERNSSLRIAQKSDSREKGFLRRVKGPILEILFPYLLLNAYGEHTRYSESAFGIPRKKRSGKKQWGQAQPASNAWKNPLPHNVMRYTLYLMIESFQGKETEKIFARQFSKKLPTQIQQITFRKLRMLNRSSTLQDLRVPPANRLEALSGGRKGQHRIRINQQWRICFVWKNGNAYQVEIMDYH